MGDSVNPELIRTATWMEHPKYPGLLELWTEGSESAHTIMLAWIRERPHCCDRGHYEAQIEYSPGNPFDAADSNHTYYMRLETAKDELRRKLLWRLCKIRSEQ